jgi:uncharacterized protein (AIM24 family)
MQKDDSLPEAELVLAHTGWSHLDIPKLESINYAVTGHESQVLTFKLQPGDVLHGEPGSMLYLTSEVKQNVSYQGCCNRLCSGEDCFVLNLTNHSNKPGYAALSPSFPTAKVIPIDLSSTNVGGVLIAQSGSFMASYGDVRVGVSWDCNFMRCCCSGLGLVRQKLEGTGTAFLSSSGTIVTKVLQSDETILVDNNCILAYSNSCKLDLRRVGGIVGMLGSGEGMFNATLTGPGLVVVQSMNELMFKNALAVQKLYRR